MIHVDMKTDSAYTGQTIRDLNQKKISSIKSSDTILDINKGQTDNSTSNLASNSTSNPSSNSASNLTSAPSTVSAPVVSQKAIPSLIHPTMKGQKVALETSEKLTNVAVKLGWNVSNPECDVDVSAFLLGNNGKVIADSWFVFYGQTTSPDHSTIFSEDVAGQDRECISIDFTKLNPQVSKIVFVLTINEALTKNLNFSMLKDAYIRIMDAHQSEIASFLMTDYYSNVTSMMIGEIYRHNGTWKFHAVGNGVAKDLAGLCELYGVEVV